MRKFLRFKLLLPHNAVRLETFVSLVLAVTILGGQAAAVVRFYNRSLFIVNNSPGATTSYTISFGYHTLTSIGSVDILFCGGNPSDLPNDYSSIPNEPCISPPGFDASHAELSGQSGETGFSILKETTNEIVLSRASSVVGSEMSSYTFSGVVNPTDTTEFFSARLSDYSSTDASGTLIDLGSVVSQIQNPIVLESQVPPILVFCLGQEVTQNCEASLGGNFTDLGNLSQNITLDTSSQMGAGTNANTGYVITASGPTMSAGLHNIAANANPAPSNPGTNQFGINLVENTTPAIGNDPIGSATNTSVGADYAIPNEYTYKSGDPLVQASGVSVVQRYTVSYIVNSAATLPAGVYTTTLTFVCTGRF